MPTLTIKSLVRSIAVAGALSVSLAVASATPASAATYFTLIGTKSSWTYQCTPGTQYGVTPTWIGGVHHVNNGCGGRVYIYQFKGGSGWSYCISPHAAYAAVPSSYTNANGASETTSTAAC
jgi:hypothetical protein